MHTTIAQPKTSDLETSDLGRSRRFASGWFILPACLGGVCLVTLFAVYPPALVVYGMILAIIAVAFLALLVFNR